ncbi:MAG: DUF4097 family beta strand repeat-containing protein [Bacteroidota bacterium]
MTELTSKLLSGLTISLLLSFGLSANTSSPPTGNEFVKEINKSFPLNADGRVELSNRYGQINIRPWSKNEVKIDVRIVVQARDQEAADRTFERIRVSFYDTDDLVKAATEIGSRSGRSGWWPWKDGSKSSQFKIYYEVQMPESANLQAEARYCDIRCDDLSGETEFDVKYGDLVAGRLNNRTQLSIAYGSGNVDFIGGLADVEIRYSDLDEDDANNMEINSRYSELKLENCGDLDLDCRYDEVEIGKAGKVKISAGYGEFNLEEADELRGNSNYMSYEIGRLGKKLDIDTDYGDVEVGPVAPGFTEIRIRGGYSDIEILMDKNAGYEVSARASYADVDVPSSVDIKTRENKSNSESVTGTRSGTGNGRIDISSSYGDIDVREY